jgi:thioredoxin-dependent peroxiredoxin
VFRTFLRRLLSRAPRGLLAPGERAPDFAASDHMGRTVRLSELAGRRVVLWFYPKASTPG